MNLIDAFIGEHAVFYSLFDHLEDTLNDFESLGEVQRIGVVLGAAVDSHSLMEEDLFKQVDPYMGPEGSMEVVRSEHEELSATLGLIAQATELDFALEKLAHLISLSRHHFSKEEHVLFPILRRSVDAATLEKLGDEWAEKRVVLL